jgi:hypothetical protein
VDGALAAAMAGDRRIDAVRAWWRVRHPPASLGRRLDVLYMVAIHAAVFGAVAYGTASTALGQVVTPHALAVFGPSLALLGLLLGARWGAFQGPVVFPVADVAFLLGAPLPRRTLVARRLALALAAGAGAGAVAAGVAIVGLAGGGRGIAVDRAAGLAAGLTELGVLTVAAMWAVERSARWELAAWRATWLGALAAAAVAGAAGAGSIGRAVALWSGPWGWAVLPGTGSAGWAAGLGLLTAATAVAVRAVLRSGGDCSVERHLRRAEARANATASLWSFDARTARRALETVGSRGTGRRSVVLRRPRDPRLTVVWRDVLTALRTPGRVAEAAVLTGGATALALLQADRIVVLAAAILVGYFGAARMLWPLRAELDAPDRVRVLLRPRIGRVLLGHALVPVVVTTSASALAAVACAAAGALPEHGAATALVLVALTPVLTLCAGVSARRGGRLPHSILATAMAADPSGGATAVMAWFAWWPSVALTLGIVPLVLVTTAGASAALVAAGWTAAAVATLAWLLDRDPRL